MKIVIDIPEEMWERGVKEGYVPLGIGKYLKNGIPLPKGHGRLIDADAIKPIKAPIAPLTPEDTVHYDEWVYMKRWIDQTPTIIEAYKEGKTE